jgi:hypothetical protein
VSTGLGLSNNAAMRKVLGLAVTVALGTCGAQVLVERALTTGSSAISAAGAGKTAAKGISAGLGGAAKSLEAAASTSSPAKSQAPAATIQSTATAAKAVEEPAQAKPTNEALGAIKAGMERSEVLAKLGAPAQKMSIPEGSKLVERLRYVSATGDTFRLILEDGKVTEINRPN